MGKGGIAVCLVILGLFLGTDVYYMISKKAESEKPTVISKTFLKVGRIYAPYGWVLVEFYSDGTYTENALRERSMLEGNPNSNIRN